MTTKIRKEEKDMTLNEVAKELAKDLVEYKTTRDEAFFNMLVYFVSEMFNETKEETTSLLLSFVNHPDTAKVCRKYIPIMFVCESESA